MSTERYPYAEHDNGIVLTQPRPGEFEKRPMTPAELAAREPALKIAKDIYRHANQAGACYYEFWDLIAKAIESALRVSETTYGDAVCTAADHVGIPLEQIDRFLGTLQMCGWHLNPLAASETAKPELTEAREIAQKYEDRYFGLAALLKALLDRNMTFDGSNAVLPFESHDQAINHINEARRAAALPRADHIANAGNMVPTAGERPRE